MSLIESEEIDSSTKIQRKSSIDNNQNSLLIINNTDDSLYDKESSR